MYKNILIPVVFDHKDGIRKALSAARLLADKDAQVTVMHVLEAVPGYVSSQISDDILENRRKESDRLLNETTAELDGARAKLVSGHAGHTIVNYSSENDIDCIILSSHKPSVMDFFIGSTASRVVHHAACSVLVVR